MSQITQSRSSTDSTALSAAREKRRLAEALFGFFVMLKRRIALMESAVRAVNLQTAERWQDSAHRHEARRIRLLRPELKSLGQTIGASTTSSLKASPSTHGITVELELNVDSNRGKLANRAVEDPHRIVCPAIQQYRVPSKEITSGPQLEPKPFGRNLQVEIGIQVRSQEVSVVAVQRKALGPSGSSADYQKTAITSYKLSGSALAAGQQKRGLARPGFGLA